MPKTIDQEFITSFKDEMSLTVKRVSSLVTRMEILSTKRTDQDFVSKCLPKLSNEEKDDLKEEMVFGDILIKNVISVLSDEAWKAVEDCVDETTENVEDTPTSKFESILDETASKEGREDQEKGAQHPKRKINTVGREKEDNLGYGGHCPNIMESVVKQIGEGSSLKFINKQLVVLLQKAESFVTKKLKEIRNSCKPPENQEKMGRFEEEHFGTSYPNLQDSFNIGVTYEDEIISQNQGKPKKSYADMLKSGEFPSNNFEEVGCLAEENVHVTDKKVKSNSYEVEENENTVEENETPVEETDTPAEENKSNSKLKTANLILTNHLAKQNLWMTYSDVEFEGPRYAIVFKYACKLLEITTFGIGFSKKNARKNATSAMVSFILNPENCIRFPQIGNFTHEELLIIKTLTKHQELDFPRQLNYLCEKLGSQQPKYSLSDKDHIFRVKCTALQRSGTGFHRKKVIAKKLAAKEVLISYASDSGFPYMSFNAETLNSNE